MNKWRIAWMRPYRPGLVEIVVRSLSIFVDEHAARVQVRLFKAVFPGNRYYVERTN